MGAGVDVDENAVTCSDSDADVVFVIDTTSSNTTAFLVQQHRLLRTLKRLSNVLKGRSVRYGVIAFHRTPDLMLELESPFASDTQRVSDLITSLRAHQSTSNSVARALDEAMSLFFESRTRPNRRQIIILAHDGVNTDLVAETLEAVANVEKLGATVFAITGSSRPNAFALLGYSGSRDRIFATASDRAMFQESLDEALGVCEPQSASSQFSTPKKGLVRRAHGVRGRRAKEERNIFTPGQKCGEGKVDLTLVLDTSGSVFRVFEDQRQIALEILDEIPVEAYSDAVQVSVTRFAAYADVILPFLKGRSVSEINEAIKEVKFTGQNTRIASAVEIAIDEMERARRPDARQIFVLISDGHGQEYWNVVQATGKRLQETKAELFAVSASHDYNQAELLIYVGDESRVFVGPKYTGFLSILSSYLKDCIFRGRKPPATVPVGNSLSDLTKSDAAVEEFASSTAEGPLADEASTTEESPVDEFSDELSSTVRSVTVESSSAEGSAVEEASSTVEVLARSSSTSLPSTSTEEAPLAEEIAPTTSEEVLDEGNGIASTVEPSDVAEGSEEEFEDEISELDTSGQPNRAARLKDIAKASSCPVDIILMVDRSQSVVDDFRKEVELAIRSVELFSPSQYSSGRIRVGAVSFAKEAQVELSLGKSARDDVVKRLEEMVHTGGSTSAVTGARLALQSLVSSRRSNARLITLLFTDGQSQDYWRELIDTSMRIRDIPNSVLLAFTASQQFSASELQLWAGETSKVFVASEEKGFLHAIGKEVNRCRKEELVDKAEELVDVEKKPFDRQPITQTSPEVVVSTTPEGIDDDRTTIEVDEVFEFSTRGETAPFESSSVGSTVPVVDFESETTASGLEAETSTLEGSGVEDVEEGSGQRDLPIVNDNRALGILTAKEIAVISDEKQPEVLNSSTSCLTDLMLVIDRSTSVEADFQQQVQLAVDLVKRLPAVDFEDRIRVGVVVFNARAEVAFRMNEARSRSAVLDSLLGLRHAGGSTSVASGVNLALDQIDADRRKSARLMVVLLSDGNSQDHWNQVIRSSNRLRTTGAAVYAVTMSKKYMFRELELYAGDKLRVYIDARVRQFLDEVEQAVTHCGTSAKTSSSSVTLQSPKSCSSFVDLVILLDTSTPVEEFFREKQLAVDLIRALPPSAFERRLAVSVIPFSNTSTILTPLAVLPKDEVVFELERLSNATGSAAIINAVVSAISEIKSHSRKGSRVMVVIVSNGNGAEEKSRNIEKSAATLKATGAEVYAVSLADSANVDKLKAFAGSDKNLFLAARSDKFIQEVGATILSCASAEGVNNVESDNAIPQPESAVSEEKLVNLGPAKKCPYDKMDLEIILDASSSRREVFEHQRELALSLIERLPISASDHNVAVGISSFTSVPTIRLPLGTGRDKTELRAAVESVVYHGGSTLTASAVDLSVDDLLRGRRPEAIQVVVLMNDGFSQDTWEQVLASSGRLASTKAERFGVALGPEADYRELDHYIGNHDRIYRDGSTEKFLSDVLALLKGEKECAETDVNSEVVEKKSILEAPKAPPPRQLPADDCSGANLDLVVIFDNTEKASLKKRDSPINSNRYLLLDVLGSLKSGARVRISVITFDGEPKVSLDFTDISERDRIFAQIETIKAVSGEPSYSDAVSLALSKLRDDGRANARAGLVLLGSGNSKDTAELRAATYSRIKEIPRLSCFAVDSSPSTNIPALEAITGSTSSVYPYERNAEFSAQIARLASSNSDPKCNSVLGAVRERVHAVAVEVRSTNDVVYSTLEPLKAENIVQRDILAGPLNVDKFDEGKSIYIRKTSAKTTTTTGSTTARSTTTTAPSTRPTTPRPEPTPAAPLRQKLTPQLQQNFKQALRKRPTPAPEPVTDSEARSGLDRLRQRRPSLAVEQNRGLFVRQRHLGQELPPVQSTTTTRRSRTTTTTQKPTVSTPASTRRSRTTTLRATTTVPVAETTPRRSRFGTLRRSTTTTTAAPSTVTTTRAPRTRRPRFLLPLTADATVKTTRTRITTTTVPTTTRIPTSPSFTQYFPRTATLEPDEPSTTYKPGCLLDVIVVLDSSGSVEETFRREKELAAGILTRFRIGPNNAKVSIIKFAGAQQVKTVWSFADTQSKGKILRVLDRLPFSSGTTAIHSALLKVLSEYTVDHGARPGRARPIAIVFTDGYGQKSTTEEAAKLRAVVPDTYAIAINHRFPISRHELDVIVGSPDRVFTDANIGKFHEVLERIASDCILE